MNSTVFLINFSEALQNIPSELELRTAIKFNPLTTQQKIACISF